MPPETSGACLIRLAASEHLHVASDVPDAMSCKSICPCAQNAEDTAGSNAPSGRISIVSGENSVFADVVSLVRQRTWAVDQLIIRTSTNII